MGATSGIGMEIAKLCIAAGWRVGIAGRRAEPLGENSACLLRLRSWRVVSTLHVNLLQPS